MGSLLPCGPVLVFLPLMRGPIYRLRRNPHTMLQEHVTSVMRLAQIAFRDLLQANRDRYTYDAFVQSINDLGLHHQFLARGVTTVEGALALAEAYILASHMHRNRMASRQVDAEPSAAPSVPNAETPAVANVTPMTLASKVDHMTDMLPKLVAALVPPNLVDNTHEPSGPRAQSPGTGQPFCWGCGRPGHFQKSCPQLQPGLNYHGLQTLPPPPVNFQGRTKWRLPRWAPVSNLTERPPTRQVGSSRHSPPVF